VTCQKCGQVHVCHVPNIPDDRCCTGHRSGYRDETTGKRVFFPPDQQPPCTQPAMKNQTKCRSHGGKTPNGLAGGVRRKAETKARRLAMRWGVPVEVNATEAVIGQVHLWAGLELFYRQKVAQLQPEAMIWGRTQKRTGEGKGATYAAGEHAWVKLHREASRMLVHCAAEAISAGIEERRVRLAEQQGALVADVIRRILDDLGLTPEQAGRVAEVVPLHLRLLTGGAA
jgi:hypothetical protein